MKVTYYQAKNNVYTRLSGSTILRRNRKSGIVTEFDGEISGFPYTVETPDDDVWAGYLERMAENQKANDIRREEHKKEMKAIGTHLDTSSEKEVYNFVKYLAEKDKGWDAADILLGRPKNALYHRVREYLASGYFVTPFDDGQILIKADNGRRLSLKRHIKSEPLSSII